jgi:folate-dependent phosphoribosylglycinamide formyltransferase PurN
MNRKVVFLCGRSESSKQIYNGLKHKINFDAVIIENPPSKKQLFERRIKKLGYSKTFGQLLFILTVPRLLNLFSRKKKKKICKQLNLNSNPIDSKNIHEVKSANSEESLTLLKKIRPDLIIVNGTRILSKKTLSGTSAEFINTHVGITPKYRGVHGGYWALVNDDIKNFGVTIHKVNQGIDTGDIIYQKTIIPSNEDNFVTYPLVQTAAGIELILKTLKDFNSDNLKIRKNKILESKLWHHPTLWEYLYFRILRKVK